MAASLRDLRALTVKTVELSQDPGILSELLNGQLEALSEMGVEGAILSEEDFSPPVGSYAAVVRNSAGEMVGGVRVYTRSSDRPLPLECSPHPFGESLSRALAETPSVCEIKGLWVSRHAAGRLLSRKVTALGTALGYSLGHEAVVGVAHSRPFELVYGALGYQRDPRFPIVAYPDDRFMSFVVWHRMGLEALREADRLPPRVSRRVRSGNA